MKRLILALLFLALPLAALADWSVTATWTRSTGATLANEQVYYDGQAVTSCLVVPPAVTSCQFTLPENGLGKGLVIRSSNGQGAYSETTPVTLSVVPPPASGVLLSVTYVVP